MISKLKKCKNCGLRGTLQDGSLACSKFKIKINPEEDYCSWHIPESSITNCSICKQLIPSKDILIYPFQNQNLFLCDKCAQLIGTCHTCAYQQNCGFRSDRSEPQVVMRTVRQGMMTMQTQVKNPNLVQKHCLNCRCSYGTEGNCLRDSNGVACNSWSILPELLQ